MRKLAAVVVLMLVVAAGSAAAAVAIPTTVEELARGSDVVVRGRVASVTARWVGARIYSFAEVEPVSVWRGSAPVRVTVITPGGVVGRLGQRTEGVATFTPGEEIVAFLVHAESGLFRVSGLAQGKFAVDGDIARPDLSHTTFVTSPALRAAERRSEPMQVHELERRVRSAR